MSMTSGQKVLLGCGVAAALFVGSFVLLIGGCGMVLYKGAANYPAYAKADVVNPANKDITDRINKLIVDSTSMGQAQQKIGAEDWPAKVLYIGFKPEESSSSDLKDAFKRTSWSSHSVFSMNGNGYGSLSTPEGKKEIVIIERSQDTASGLTLRYTVYVEHPPGTAGP